MTVRRRSLLLSAVLALSVGGLSSCGSPPAPASPARPAEPQELSAKDIVQRYKPAIVRVENDFGTGVKVGTGFILSEEGRIATNLHVIAGNGKLRIKLSNGTILPVVRIIAIDEKRDLAIIKVESETPLPTVPLGDSDKVSPGDSVIAIGNPQNFDFTVSDGLISSVREDGGDTVLQISAPISQGSSGGPLFNNFGQVIGVATMIYTQGQNLNFGVPANYLRPMMSSKGGESAADFAKRFERPAPANGQVQIMREVPMHKLEILKGCTDKQFAKVYTGINRAIELGAPLYNEGDHEACYGIYQQTAAHFERDNSMCKGLRDTFGVGLLKAETKRDFTRKAWAMRDAFDGVLRVLVRKAQAQ
ncbi:MAG: serine protease [Kofleriaceae bacterium]|nr:serine protease [Kofleriaceae bacterium]